VGSGSDAAAATKRPAAKYSPDQIAFLFQELRTICVVVVVGNILYAGSSERYEFNLFSEI
jgi:hypothetical protein